MFEKRYEVGSAHQLGFKDNLHLSAVAMRINSSTLGYPQGAPLLGFRNPTFSEKVGFLAEARSPVVYNIT
jgi:hypothetical protein